MQEDYRCCYGYVGSFHKECEKKHKCFLILYRNKNLNKEQEKNLNELMDQNKKLYETYLLKEQVLSIFDRKQKNIALERLKSWKENVQKSDIEEFQKVLKTLEHYLYGIENYFTHH